MTEICPKEQCTGCSACYAACHSNAIEMRVDEFGFVYPQINKDKCINCGICQKSCPNNQAPSRELPSDCYVCHAIDMQEQLTSTSGGVASAISRYVIHLGGVVYGCSSQPNVLIRHIRVDNENDLHLLKGSKYVQSTIGNIYRDVKKDLQSGRLVLFIGTPCQIAGIRSFLRKNYENLITIDFVCHGVPSVKYLDDSIKCADKVHSCVSFRKKQFNDKKDKYDSIYGVYLVSPEKGLVYQKSYPKGLYILGFIHALFYRDSCYSCNYSQPKRVSDFTVGDYHDTERAYSHLSGHDRILSMLTLNTPKAKELFTQLSKVFEFSSCSLEVILAKHEQMNKPMPRHRNYYLFRDIFLKKGFAKAAKTALSKERYNNIKRLIKNTLLSCLRRKSV